MKSNMTQSQTRTFEYSRVFQFSTGEVSYRRMAPDGYPLYIDPNQDPYTRIKRPNPPTAEMIKRAQPYRADILEQDCIIKDPQHRFNG